MRGPGQPLAQRRHATVRRGQGQFAEIEVVQDLGGLAAVGVSDQLLNDSGLRLAQPTGRRTYKGTTLATPQKFTRAPAAANSDEAIRAGMVTATTASRMLNKTRGRLQMPRAGGDS